MCRYSVGLEQTRAYILVCSPQVTSKGAGLNPNAKVWQEMPSVPSEAPADGTEGSPWSQTNIPEGKAPCLLLVGFLYSHVPSM